MKSLKASPSFTNQVVDGLEENYQTHVYERVRACKIAVLRCIEKLLLLRIVPPQPEHLSEGFNFC